MSESELPPAAPPEPIGWPLAAPGEPGLKVGFPDARRYAPPRHRVSHTRMLLLLASGLGLLALILVLVAVLAAPPAPRTCGRFGCQGPPVPVSQASAGPPVEAGQLYQNPQGFSVRFYPSGLGPQVRTFSTGIELQYEFNSQAGGPSELYVIGGPSNGSNASTIINDELQQIAPNAQFQFDEPQPLIGYQPGVGAVFDSQVASSDGSTSQAQISIMVAIVNNFMISAVGIGTDMGYQTPKSIFWDDHPSPARASVAYVADPVLNHILFPSS